MRCVLGNAERTGSWGRNVARNPRVRGGCGHDAAGPLSVDRSTVTPGGPTQVSDNLRFDDEGGVDMCASNDQRSRTAACPSDRTEFNWQPADLPPSRSCAVPVRPSAVSARWSTLLTLLMAVVLTATACSNGSNATPGTSPPTTYPSAKDAADAFFGFMAANDAASAYQLFSPDAKAVESKDAWPMKVSGFLGTMRGVSFLDSPTSYLLRYQIVDGSYASRYLVNVTVAFTTGSYTIAHFEFTPDPSVPTTTTTLSEAQSLEHCVGLVQSDCSARCAQLGGKFFPAAPDGSLPASCRFDIPTGTTVPTTKAPDLNKDYGHGIKLSSTCRQYLTHNQSDRYDAVIRMTLDFPVASPGNPLWGPNIDSVCGGNLDIRLIDYFKQAH